jgi:hypothetical protein
MKGCQFAVKKETIKLCVVFKIFGDLYLYNLQAGANLKSSLKQKYIFLQKPFS